MSRKSGGGPNDYVIGRGKPPKHTRFRPGQSGNPNGRPKGAPNLGSVYAEVFASRVKLTENGRPNEVPLVKALVLRQVQDGLRGSPRALEHLLDRYERHVGAAEEEHRELPDEDRALLARVLTKKATDSAEAGEEESDD